MKPEDALQQILGELNRWNGKDDEAIASDMEGCAIIKDRFDDLWNLTRSGENVREQRAAAKRLGAAVLKHMTDIL